MKYVFVLSLVFLSSCSSFLTSQNDSCKRAVRMVDSYNQAFDASFDEYMFSAHTTDRQRARAAFETFSDRIGILFEMYNKIQPVIEECLTES